MLYVCFVDRQGSSVQRPAVGPQWADCDAHPVATVPGTVRLQPTGGYTEPPGMAPVSVCQKGGARSSLHHLHRLSVSFIVFSIALKGPMLYIFSYLYSLQWSDLLTNSPKKKTSI